ncbi:MAG: nucleotidyltransferase domain-containing protein [Kiritimatiellae bacterium]|nr:nucleotidyltransferase domain-containing protein [Kiritimatiellia bacterium]
MHYTVHQDPSIDAVIDQHMQTIRTRLLSRFGWRIHAIILVGGFGRGEGSIRQQDESIAPLNDYDLAIIVNTPRSRRLPLEDLAKELADTLSIRFVDLAAVWRFKLTRTPASMFAFDMRHAAHVIYGPKHVCSRMPDYSPGSVSIFEGINQIANRLIAPTELVTPAEWQQSQASDVRTVLQLGKLVTAIGDALVIQAGRYTSHYADRATRWNASVLDGHMLAPFRDFVFQAYQYKLRPETVPSDLDLRAYLRRTVALLATAMTALGGNPASQNTDAIDIDGYLACRLSNAWRPPAPRTLSQPYLALEREALQMLQTWAKADVLTSEMTDHRDALLRRWLEGHH